MLAMAKSMIVAAPACGAGVPLAVSQECQPQAASFAASQCGRRNGGSLFHRSSLAGKKVVEQALRMKGVAACKQGTAARAEAESSGPSGRIIKGPCFVVEDNIDTDQIIPAEYLTLVPSKPDEYEKLGSYAMVGLPAKYGRYIEEGQIKTKYPIMIGGNNFGCGSSREHAPVAMGAAGCKAVVAPSFARIYFRNCVATGELYPVESEVRLCDQFTTGDEVTVDMEHDFVINHTTGKQYQLKPIGEAGPVIDAGGIFNYARSTGMISSPVTA